MLYKRLSSSLWKQHEEKTQYTEEITLSPIKWAAPERELSDMTNK
jgi:hypothetical protein